MRLLNEDADGSDNDLAGDLAGELRGVEGGRGGVEAARREDGDFTDDAELRSTGDEPELFAVAEEVHASGAHTADPTS